MVLVVRALIPDDILDIVAAKRPAITRPLAPPGRIFTVK
jgi:hypothetical protein